MPNSSMRRLGAALSCRFCRESISGQRWYDVIFFAALYNERVDSTGGRGGERVLFARWVNPGVCRYLANVIESL
jgi:hypothetical protein